MKTPTPTFHTLNAAVCPPAGSSSVRSPRFIAAPHRRNRTAPSRWNAAAAGGVGRAGKRNAPKYAPLQTLRAAESAGVCSQMANNLDYSGAEPLRKPTSYRPTTVLSSAPPKAPALAGRKMLASLLCLLVWLGIAASAGWAQSVYTPYTFGTLAGLAGSFGSTDGTGSAARFVYPYGLATDSAGNVYVADGYNHTIRKITPVGVVTTLAGLAGSVGSADGTGSAARFNFPTGVATDSAGNVYVADTSNYTLRKITPAGVVTTLAGLAGSLGSADGTGSAARFNNPYGVATDLAGNVYVADTFNSTIRKITPAGVVTTLAGPVGSFSFGSADGTSSAARFYLPSGVATGSAGNVYVADTSNHTIRKGAVSVDTAFALPEFKETVTPNRVVSDHNGALLWSFVNGP